MSGAPFAVARPAGQQCRNTVKRSSELWLAVLLQWDYAEGAC